MESGMCSICRTMSRISLVIAVIMASLVFQQICVSSLKLEDQPCKLRPTIIPVEEKGFKPHHIELHRCEGTCGNSQPSQKPCVPKSIQQISLDLTDLTSETKQKKVVRKVNHTSCGCDCKAINHCKVDEGEMPDEDNCRCIKTGPTPQTHKGGNEKVDVRPYQIGLVVLGLFALCVLVLDMIMCAKGQGVIYKVKENCCLSDDVDGNRGEVRSNGKCSAEKETRNGHTSPAEERV